LTELGDGDIENETRKLREFISEIKTMPIAVNQANANEQHYEVRTHEQAACNTFVWQNSELIELT
jgi:hypothetical protein